jgi:hypothetical protein
VVLSTWSDYVSAQRQALSCHAERSEASRGVGSD